MKSKRTDSPPKAKAGAVRAAASKPPSAIKPRKKARSAAADSPAVDKVKASAAPKKAAPKIAPVRKTPPKATPKTRAKAAPPKAAPKIVPAKVTPAKAAPKPLAKIAPAPKSAPKVAPAPVTPAKQVALPPRPTAKPAPVKAAPAKAAPAQRAAPKAVPVAATPVKTVPAPAPPAKPVLATAAPAKAASKTPAKIARPQKAPVQASPRKPEQPAAPQKAAPSAKARIVPPPAGKAKDSPRSAPPPMPPILLEGDEPAPVPAGGPGRRYVLGPLPPPLNPAPAGAGLPESYGTRQLLLTARDPRWLYAQWDFSAAQVKEYNALSADKHLLLRLYRDAPGGQPVLQIHLHPESRHWFVPAPYPGVKYMATLGYFDASNEWVEAARSAATLTPPDSPAEDTAVRFATIPADVPLAQLLPAVRAAVRESAPLAEEVKHLREESFSRLPKPAKIAGPRTPAGEKAPAEEVPHLREEGFSGLPKPEEIAGPWTPAQEEALAEIVRLDPAHRVWIGSLEVTELIRRQLEHEMASISAAQLSLPFPPGEAPGGISSPSAGPEQQRGFWFNINAELIVYGSTEPDAAVTIGGRPIRLRRDGSFSFRFALPDGRYELPVAAYSADHVETRVADLAFSRASEYHGEVAAHPQDETLQLPLPGSVE